MKNNICKFFINILFVTYLLGCAAEPPNANIPSTPVEQQRIDLLYGYFGSTPTQLAETSDHVNLYFAAVWDGQEEQTKQIIDARNLGIPVILDMVNEISWPFDLAAAEVRTRIRFEQLQAVGGSDINCYSLSNR